MTPSNVPKFIKSQKRKVTAENQSDEEFKLSTPNKKRSYSISSELQYIDREENRLPKSAGKCSGKQTDSSEMIWTTFVRSL